ncbi:chitinase [Rickenella mellea]|uniref:Chitinase n=1 Tax=Rickenella mellea TaxID=50990 RepID=A0A4Y7Q9V8_9AGAM|nr:chitinase [Rickenella mellea]
MVATSWYAGYHVDDVPLSSVSWDKYTHMAFFVATTTDDSAQLSTDLSNGTVLPEFVSLAHKHGVKAGISIGGWTGSIWFSSFMGSAANRTRFVTSVTDFVKKYKLDYVDFDWEYPNRQGIGCNTINANDTANFLAFLQELRQTEVGKKLIISAATSLFPWNDATGAPMTDAKPFADVFDFIEIMNYDVWGPWSSSVGPNAPLNDSCAAPANQQGSAVAAVKAWTAAGMPTSKIVLGVPAYGHSFYVAPSNAFVSNSTTTLAAYPPFDNSLAPHGDAWSGDDDLPTTDVCGNPMGVGGTFAFRGMVEGGWLTKAGKPASGILSRFDGCSQTPYVYNASDGTMISYDNAQSFRAKGDYIKQNKLRGFAMFETGGDFNNVLLDSILEATGMK